MAVLRLKTGSWGSVLGPDFEGFLGGLGWVFEGFWRPFWASKGPTRGPPGVYPKGSVLGIPWVVGRSCLGPPGRDVGPDPKRY
jgi:hypothetical protein